MSAPWRELLDFYQAKEDSRIRYEQVVGRFQPRGLLDAALVLPLESDEVSWPMADGRGDITLESVSYIDEDGIRRVDAISLAIPAGEHAALIGPTDSGRSEITMLLGRVLSPSAGRIRLGEADLNALPFAASARHVAYVGPAELLLAGSLRDNLLFGLRRPPLAVVKEGAMLPTAKSANTLLDQIDYRQAGILDQTGLESRILEVLRIVNLWNDVYQFGLRGRVDPSVDPEVAERLLQARYHLSDLLQSHGATDLVERFDPERYNDHIPVAINLLFGTARDWQPEKRAVTLAAASLATQPFIAGILHRTSLDADLLRIGLHVAEKTEELFNNFPPGHEVFERFSLVRPDEFLAVKKALAKAHQAGSPDRLDADTRTRFEKLGLSLVAGHDRLLLIDEDIRARVLEARHVIASEMPAELRDRIEFFDPVRYNAALSVRGNVLFGALVRGRGVDPAALVEALIAKAVEDLGDIIVARVGLAFQVGSGGIRLTAPQRQKVALAASILRRPDTALVLDGATAALDAATERRVIEELKRELSDGRSLVCGLERLNLARAIGFDLIVAVENGKLAPNRPEDACMLPGSAAGASRLSQAGVARSVVGSSGSS